MKRNKIISILIIIAGVLLMIGTSTLFKTCDITEKVMKCYWAGKSEIAIGGILLVVGILMFISKAKESKIMLSIISVTTSISAILIPMVIIGGCKKVDMVCRTTSYPCIYLISAIAIVISIVNIILECKIKK